VPLLFATARSQRRAHRLLTVRGRVRAQYVASRDEEYALLMGLKEVVDGSTVWTVKGQSVLATQQAVLCP
jgi:hypothetical protein